MLRLSVTMIVLAALLTGTHLSVATEQVSADNASDTFSDTANTTVSNTANETPRLAPYSARYSTTAMGLGMTLKRSLKVTDGNYVLRNEGKVLVASLSEVANFTIEDGQIRGKDFVYQLKGIINRRREVKFRPETQEILSLRKDRWTVHPFDPNILDRLSQQEQVRLDLLAADKPPEQLVFTVVDGPRVRERVLELVGEEKIRLKPGELTTLHYRQVHDNPKERSSDTWIAPELDYLMVRTVHVEDGTEVKIELHDVVFEEDSTDP